LLKIHPIQTRPIKILASILFSFALLGLIPLLGQDRNTPEPTVATSELSSAHLIPGEQSILIVRLQNGRPDNRPAAPQVTGCAINFIRSTTILDASRKFTTAFLFRVTPVKPGAFTIPSIAIRSKGVTYHTKPTTFQVHSLDSLFKLPTRIGSHQILAGWFPEKKTLYEKETCQVSLKLYVPIQLPIALNGWGLPTPVKENCLAWRFSLPQSEEITQVTVDGISYRSATFNTSLSGILPGTATFGPAPLRIIVRQSVIDPLRGSRLTNHPVNITIPETSFKILPLPKGAPPHFNGAVGQFSIQASCQQTELQENKPTEVTIKIQGKGNLKTLHAPALNEDNWKIIDTSKIERDNNRRSIEGEATFQQLIRPKRNSQGELPTCIPSYTLSYFDPSDHAYHTEKTPPIPVHVTRAPTSASNTETTPIISEKLGTAPEEMRNILGIIDHPNVDFKSKKTLRSPSLWHLIPATLALIIFSVPLLKKINQSLKKSPDTIAQQKELAALSKETNPIDFYRESGRFIERWLTHHQTPLPSDIQEILTERDQLCFLEKEASTAPQLTKERKKKILSRLKQTSKLTLLLLLTLPAFQSVKAQQPQHFATPQQAWEAHDYQQALTLYQKKYPTPATTPPDILYNIGNCHYQLKQPGLAALAWRRALALDPTHLQSKQNLRFLELEHQSIVPHYEPWQHYLLKLRPSTFQLIFYGSLWIFLLCLLVLILLRPRKKLATPIISLLIISPLTASLGGLALHWYPDDHLFAPISEQAVTLEKSILYAAPHHLAKHSAELPPASLLHIDAVRGPWVHVHTVDHYQGWIPNKKISQVLEKTKKFHHPHRIENTS